MFGHLSGWELVVILVIGIILFGKRLPEVGRSLGKSIVEFKKAIKGVEEGIEESSREPSRPRSDDRISGESPKFEVPPRG